MSNPVDHTIDLGFVNYVQHPENPDYIVFRFSDHNRGLDFERALIEQNIWFEKGEELKRNKVILLYGIHRTDYKKVEKINYQVEARHKKPAIPWKGVRYSVLIITLAAIILASVGYCKQQEILRSHDKTNRSVNHNH